MNPTLALLLSPINPGALAPAHRADLAKSGLTTETVVTHRIRAVPPSLIRPLLGFDPGPSKIASAYLLPFPDPDGGWFDHIRLKVFPSYRDTRGRTVKYLGPPGAPPRLYFPIAPRPAVMDGAVPLWLVEGAKKALAVAQLGLPAIGFEGIEGWHRRGAATTLLPDFDRVPLAGRIVELVPDGDVQINPAVRAGAVRLSDALRARGAAPRLVSLPLRPNTEAG